MHCLILMLFFIWIYNCTKMSVNISLSKLWYTAISRHDIAPVRWHGNWYWCFKCITHHTNNSLIWTLLFRQACLGCWKLQYMFQWNCWTGGWFVIMFISNRLNQPLVSLHSTVQWLGQTLSVWYKTKFGSQNFGYQLWYFFIMNVKYQKYVQYESNNNVIKY